MEVYHTGEKEKFVMFYHPSADHNLREYGIVICAPLGQEYARYYKTLFSLATSLAQEGYHTIRFDYYGTGDSYGNEEEVSLGTCADNIKTAVNELLIGCGVQHICLIGTRLGALLAMDCASQIPVQKLILWDPVLNGGDYLTQIQAYQQEFIGGSFCKIQKNAESAEEIECAGFVYSAALVHELKSHKVLSPDYMSAGKTLLLTDHPPTNLSKDAGITVLETGNKQFWRKKESENDKSQVALSEIQNIITWLNNAL